MEKIKQIIDTQFEFQKMVGFPIESNLERDRNEMSEKFIFKMIEECIELRKEAPSAINPWSKKQKDADLQRIKEEMSDILLFFLNLTIVWKIDFEDLLGVVEKTQSNNIKKIKEKMMSIFHEEILGIPGTIGVGHGNISPKYVFIGQNPGQSIYHGYRFFSDENDGSSKVLLPILKNLGILEDCYFTNLVKCTTKDNEKPSQEVVDFWKPFLFREVDILKKHNLGLKIIDMGNWTSEQLEGPRLKITHPAAILRGTKTYEEYEQEIRETITSSH